MLSVRQAMKKNRTRADLQSRRTKNFIKFNNKQYPQNDEKLQIYRKAQAELQIPLSRERLLIRLNR
jgi:hypothetical protein